VSIHYEVGRYKCTVKQQGFTTAKTGTQQFYLVFDVTATDGGESVAIHERTYYKALTEKTIEYFATDAKNLGFTGGSLTQLDPSSPQHFSLVGREVTMFCKHGTDASGNAREEWEVGMGAREMKPADATKLRSLDVLFGNALKRSGGPRPVAAMPPPPPMAAAPVNNDDVPF